MSCVCLWSPRWSIGEALLAELGHSLLEVSPRVVVEERGVVWVDGRGLPSGLPLEVLERAGGADNEVKAGVSAVPIAAEAAARYGAAPVTAVEPGGERDYLAPLPLDWLQPDVRLQRLLDGVGVTTCGAFAALEREAVEIRFGGGAVTLWRLARGDDSRLLFVPIPPERPNASMLFVGYEVRQAERLLFTVNALLGSICGKLRGRGERAREMVLALTLSAGGTLREVLRTSRPTADAGSWLRRIRELLDRLRLPDAVVGIELQAGVSEPVSATQGDLFDRGFATAAPVEEAVIRLMDRNGSIFVEPETSAHPILERRTRWKVRPPEAAAEIAPSPGESGPLLTLQLLPEPRRVRIRKRRRRDHAVPTAYFDGANWHTLVATAGPDRVSGGTWEEAPYAREYYRCTTGEGVLVWLFRDQADDVWYLHGWWD
jgi:protein ImuB